MPARYRSARDRDPGATRPIKGRRVTGLSPPCHGSCLTDATQPASLGEVSPIFACPVCAIARGDRTQSAEFAASALPEGTTSSAADDSSPPLILPFSSPSRLVPATAGSGAWRWAESPWYPTTALCLGLKHIRGCQSQAEDTLRP
jgi:hypothetical protein